MGEPASVVCGMLLASPGAKMLRRLEDDLPAQCTEVPLACPAVEMVVVSDLHQVTKANTES